MVNLSFFLCHYNVFLSTNINRNKGKEGFTRDQFSCISCVTAMMPPEIIWAYICCHAVMNTTGLRVNWGTKTTAGEDFYRLEWEEEGRAGQRGVYFILLFCRLLLHLRGLDPQMGTVVLRLIMMASLTAFEEPTLGRGSGENTDI